MGDIARLHPFQLFLDGTSVDSDGINKLSHLENLARMSLARTHVDDACAETLSELPMLSFLCLSRTRVTDATVIALAKAPRLTQLDIGSKGITDGAIEALGRMTSLNSLKLNGSQITVQGASRLNNALPGCSIIMAESGNANRDLNPEMRVARYVIQLGGKCYSKSQPFHPYAAPQDLIGVDDISISRIDLSATNASDGCLWPLLKLTSLVELDLSHTLFREAVALSQISSLQSLSLAGTEMSMGKLSRLRNLSNLRQLDIRGVKIVKHQAVHLGEILPACTIIWDGGTIN